MIGRLVIDETCNVEIDTTLNMLALNAHKTSEFVMIMRGMDNGKYESINRE